MICKKCGKGLKEGATFCTVCGERQNGIPNADQEIEKTIGMFNVKSTQQQTPPYQNAPKAQSSEQETSQQPTPAPAGNNVGQTAGATSSNTQNSQGQPTLKELYIEFFQKSFDFQGRTSKADYWRTWLCNLLVLIIPVVGAVALLVALIPGFALSVRRLHDVGKSGKMMLISTLC